MQAQILRKVDHSALKGNQLTIISLSLLAFILNLPALAAFVALVMVIGSLFKVPGFIVLGVGSIALFLGADVPGWVLVWLVIALASFNVFREFCVGCAVYYWLARMNFRGFTKTPPAGSFRA